MKKLLAAGVAVLVFAIAASAALASHQTVTVKATGVNYQISGKAPTVGAGHVSTMKILSNGHEVAKESRFQVPSASNHYAFWYLTKKEELPSGSYVLCIVSVVNSHKTTLKFPFSIS